MASSNASGAVFGGFKSGFFVCREVTAHDALGSLKAPTLSEALPAHGPEASGLGSSARAGSRCWGSSNACTAWPVRPGTTASGVATPVAWDWLAVVSLSRDSSSELSSASASSSTNALRAALSSFLAARRRVMAVDHFRKVLPAASTTALNVARWPLAAAMASEPSLTVWAARDRCHSRTSVKL